MSEVALKDVNGSLKDMVREFERQLITRTLKAYNGNQSMAARQLGIHRNTLITKMQELEISKNPV